MINSLESYQHVFHEKGIELVLPDFVQSLAEEQLMQIVPGVDGWIIGDDSVNWQILNAGKEGKLKSAVKWGVGVDNIDFSACKDLGFDILNTPGMFGNEVADVAISYLLGLARETYLLIEKFVKVIG